MAEATDRPRDAGEVPSGGAAAPAGDQHITAWPGPGGAAGAEPAAAPAAEETYRPLSLQALAGFGVAVVYALVVVAGAAVALVNHIPYLMPKWSFLVPVAAVLVCWLARWRIRTSEGTLSGLPFTTWGMRLSVLVGLCYAAYYGSTYFALRQQAKKCAEEFFGYLKKGSIEKAYMLSLDPSMEKLSDDELRNMIEATHNAPAGAQQRPGPFTMFRQTDFVRMIQEGKDQSRQDLLGVSEWGHEPGGYRMILKYQVFTPLADFQMTVTTFCPDGKPGERPQWHVLLRRGETRADSATAKLTPEGMKVRTVGTSAQGFVASWQEKLTQEAWDEVYLDTLPPAERARLRDGARQAWLVRTAPVAGLAPLALRGQALRTFLDGRKTLRDGKLFRLDNPAFWIYKQEREAIEKRIRQTFQLGADGRPTFLLRLQPSQVPVTRAADGERTFLFDVQILYMDEATGVGMPRYVAEGQIAVSGDEREVGKSPSAWRIASIELLSARNAPLPQPARQSEGPARPGLPLAPEAPAPP